jgi:GAF domain-containing protein
MSVDAPGEIRTLRGELLEAHRDLNRLRMQCDQVLAANRDLSTQLTAAARSGGELLRTMVAFRQLLESADAADAIRGIADIMINIVGTEDFAILASPGSGPMHVVGGMGPAMSRYRSLEPSIDVIAATTWRIVPLLIREHVVGAIAIDGLLPHREALTSADEQVLSLLAQHAGTAIVVSSQRSSWTHLDLDGIA